MSGILTTLLQVSKTFQQPLEALLEIDVVCCSLLGTWRQQMGLENLFDHSLTHSRTLQDGVSWETMANDCRVDRDVEEGDKLDG